MRKIAIAGTLTLLFAAASGSKAEAAAFCAQDSRGGENCGFHTYYACMKAISGVGGICIQNPRAYYVVEEYVPRRKKRHRKPRYR